MPGGRPTLYSQEIAAEICRLMSVEGMTLRAICRLDHMPDKTTVLDWLIKHDGFATQYARAREGLADYWAEEITEITDNETRDLQPDGRGGYKSDNTAVNRDRLKAESRLKLMALFAPKKYGVKVVNEHKGDIKITAAVDAPPQESHEQWAKRIEEKRKLDAISATATPISSLVKIE